MIRLLSVHPQTAIGIEWILAKTIPTERGGESTVDHVANRALFGFPRLGMSRLASLPRLLLTWDGQSAAGTASLASSNLRLSIPSNAFESCHPKDEFAERVCE